LKPLIAIHSCLNDIRNGRNQAIRETWLQGVEKYADYRFFIGGHPASAQDDEVWFPGVDDTGNNLMEKDAAILEWALSWGYEHILKTETDVYLDLPIIFNMDYKSDDVIGALVGWQWGAKYPRTNVKCFIQGHAIWYSKKAAEYIANGLLDTYKRLSPTAETEPGQADLGPRSSDLWSGQLIEGLWRQGKLTVRTDGNFGRGPYSYHLQGNYDVKSRAPEWLHKMHNATNRAEVPWDSI